MRPYDRVQMTVFRFFCTARVRKFHYFGTRAVSDLIESGRPISVLVMDRIFFDQPVSV
jgi:hypothetical protein